MSNKVPELPKTSQKHREKSSVLYGRLLKEYVLHYKFRLIAAIVFMIIGAITTSATAFLMKPIVDEVFFEKNPEIVLFTTIAVVFIFTLRGFSTFGQAYFMQWVGNRVVADIQRDLFRKLIFADLAWFHENSTGQLISRFVYDTNLLRLGSTQALVVFTKDSLTAIFLIGSLFYYDWKMALIIFVALPPGAIAIRQVGKLARKASRRVLEQTGTFSTFLEEAFQGIRVIKAYSHEEQMRLKGDKEIEHRFRYQFKAMRIQATSNPIVETISGVMIAFVIYYGASRVTAGETTPGTFFAFITAVMLAYQPIKSIAKIAPQIQNSLAAAQRIFDLLDLVDEVVEKPGATPLELHKGEVEFKSVGFGYGAEEPVLNNISLSIPAGKRVALVGPSGGGKSTILNLMPRFYDVSQGEILVDGQNVKDVTLKSLREKFALVSQDIFLFDDTIRANIGYGRDGATDEEIQSAAKAAAIHDFIVSLPEV
ncbi:ABC transporter ATP-binding protein [Sneathiella glossodoripedis]|uniref:ABC transporter ATP-binding protein n=1 Tax=Sneathiella glossodoripedis TaxID=418853 RepID=UPI0011DE46DD|nr:ABC transporter ATP-binding protein [Sneathiella glossodoripedis]